MKFGNVFWHEDGEFSSIIRKGKQLGLDFVEICLDYPWPDYISENEILATKKTLTDVKMDVAFHDPLGGALMFHPRKEMVNAAVAIHRKCLEFAAKLGPIYYNFHIKTHPLELRIAGNRDTALENCLRGLDELIGLARELKVRLVLENSTSTGYLVPFEELLPRKIDFNLDIGHWFAGKKGYEELERLVSLLEGRIALLHLHDCRFQNAPIESHLPLGEGNIDFNQVLEALRKAGVQVIALEIGSRSTRFLEQNLSVTRSLVKRANWWNFRQPFNF